jgi:hypothetical protein
MAQDWGIWYINVKGGGIPGDFHSGHRFRRIVVIRRGRRQRRMPATTRTTAAIPKMTGTEGETGGDGTGGAGGVGPGVRGTRAGSRDTGGVGVSWGLSGAPGVEVVTGTVVSGASRLRFAPMAKYENPGVVDR